MKTDPVTIATTNPDKHLKKYSKELLIDWCQQINSDPKPVYMNNIIIGITHSATTKTMIHKNRIKLAVEMEIPEEMIMKGIECFFIPACDDYKTEKKGTLELITEGKVVGICMVKEHYDTTIDPVIFPYKIGSDYFVFDGSFLDKETVEALKLSKRPSYIFYSGDWTEVEVKRDARNKGMMKESLDQTFPPFSICHDPPEKTLTEFTKSIEKIWTSQNLQNSENLKKKLSAKRSSA